MENSKDPELKISTKLQILQRLFKNEEIESIIDKLEIAEVVELQRFIWEKTVEFGIITNGKKFSRTDITRRMVPTSQYQEMKNCKEPSFVCKGTQCIHSNPICAIEKIKSHVTIMSAAMRDYVGIKIEEETPTLN